MIEHPDDSGPAPDPVPDGHGAGTDRPSVAGPCPERRLARLDAIADGALVRCSHGDTVILLCRVGADVHAVADACTHEDVSLSLGALTGHRLACPLHGAVFDVRDGAVLAEPARVPLRTWPVRIVGGWVEFADD